MNENQVNPTDKARVVAVTPAQSRIDQQTGQETDKPPCEEQEQTANQADNPNSIEYWKQLANLNGESCRKLTEALRTEAERSNDALREIISLKEQLAAEQLRKIISVPDNLYTLFANFTTGKVQSITIYFSTDREQTD